MTTTCSMTAEAEGFAGTCELRPDAARRTSAPHATIRTGQLYRVVLIMPSRMSLPQDAEHRFTGSAPYWEKYRELIRQMFAPVTKALLADAGVTPGDTVLDVATGAGDPALSVAQEVGSSGKVIGIDP